MRKNSVTAIFAILVLLGLILSMLYVPFMKTRYPLKYEDIISSCSEEFDLPEELIASIIFCESSFREDAVSHAGAVGLMQLTPDTYDWLSRLMGDRFPGGDITDPETNITCGCYFMRFMIDRFDSTESAIAGYNAGYGAVGKWLEDESYSDDGIHLKEIPYKETASYVERVLKIKDVYKELYFKEE